jgi:hypothetical protein
MFLLLAAVLCNSGKLAAGPIFSAESDPTTITVWFHFPPPPFSTVWVTGSITVAAGNMFESGTYTVQNMNAMDIFALDIGLADFAGMPLVAAGKTLVLGPVVDPAQPVFATVMGMFADGSTFTGTLSQMPEPGALPLLGAGLLAVWAGWRRRLR